MLVSPERPTVRLREETKEKGGRITDAATGRKA
jgi:regulator of extracellular matrix RemA (YlzA/DUF370 family)